MRIAYVSNYLGNNFRSLHAKNASYSISGTFKSHGVIQTLLANNHHVSVFSTGITNCNKYIFPFSEVVKSKYGNYNVHYTNIFSYRKCSPINSLFLFVRLLRVRKNFDAIIYYNINENSIVSVLAFRKKIKILEYEDNIFNKSTPNNFNKLQFLFKKLLSNFIFEYSDKAIVVAKKMIDKNKVEKQFHFPGYVITSNQYDSYTIKNLVPFKIYLAGGAHYSKGFDILIDSLKYLPKIEIEVHLYSNTTITNEIENLINKLDKTKKIFIHDFIEQKDLLDIFNQNAHVLISTTRNMNLPNYTAGFPFKMLEYAFTGKPIISSEIGKLEEKFDNNICFYKDDCPKNLAKSIIEVYNNYDLYLKKANKLKFYVSKFYTLESISKRMNLFI